MRRIFLLSLGVLLVVGLLAGCRKKENVELPEVFMKQLDEGVGVERSSSKDVHVRDRTFKVSHVEAGMVNKRIDVSKIGSLAKPLLIHLVPSKGSSVLRPVMPNSNSGAAIPDMIGFSGVKLGSNWGVCSADALAWKGALMDASNQRAVAIGKLSVPGLALWAYARESVDLPSVRHASCKVQPGDSLFVVGIARGVYEIYEVLAASKIDKQWGSAFSGTTLLWPVLPIAASGAVVLNSKGEFCGVLGNVSDGIRGEDLSLMVPADRLTLIDATMFEGLKRNAKPWLGIVLEELSSKTRKALGVPIDINGLVVKRIHLNSPAANSELELGDVVVEFAGAKLDGSVEQVKALLQKFKPGDSVPIAVWRDGKLIPLKLQVISKPQDPDELKGNSE